MKLLDPEPLQPYYVLGKVKIFRVGHWGSFRNIEVCKFGGGGRPLRVNGPLYIYRRSTHSLISAHNALVSHLMHVPGFQACFVLIMLVQITP